MVRVSVVFPVRNAAAHVREALGSILGQTFRDIEVLALEGGSTDGTQDILHEVARADARVRVLERPDLGFVERLNLGCMEARGEFIARMDADDVAHRERFQRQLNFLEAHQDVDVLGAAIVHVGPERRRGTDWIPPTDPVVVRWRMLWENAVAHPTVMARRESLLRTGLYDVAKQYAEDYDLWARVSRVGRVANLPDILLERRLWDGAIGVVHQDVQRSTHVRIMHEGLLALGVSATYDEVTAARAALVRPEPDADRLGAAVKVLWAAHAAFSRHIPMTKTESHAVLADARELERRMLPATAAANPAGALLRFGATARAWTRGVIGRIRWGGARGR